MPNRQSSVELIRGQLGTDLNAVATAGAFFLDEAGLLEDLNLEIPTWPSTPVTSHTVNSSMLGWRPTSHILGAGCRWNSPWWERSCQSEPSGRRCSVPFPPGTPYIRCWPGPRPPGSRPPPRRSPGPCGPPALPIPTGGPTWARPTAMFTISLAFTVAASLSCRCTQEQCSGYWPFQGGRDSGRRPGRRSEKWVHEAWRAGSHNHPIKPVFPDVRFDLFLPRIGARVKRILGQHDSGGGSRIFSHSWQFTVPPMFFPQWQT